MLQIETVLLKMEHIWQDWALGLKFLDMFLLSENTLSIEQIKYVSHFFWAPLFVYFFPCVTQ